MKAIHIIVILLATAFQASGVEFFDNLLRRAAEEGFENLYMERGEPKAPVLFYENRVYRDEFYAAAVLLAICEEELPEAEHIILCRCRNRVPLVELAVDLTDYRRIVRDGEPMAAREWLTLRSPRHKLPREAEVRERAAGRFDLILTPGLGVYLGNYDDRFKAHLQVLPALSTQLWRGGSMVVEAAVPVYSDVNYQSYRFKSYSQLNRAVLSQFMRLPGNVFLFLHAGAFYPNRWGFGGEAAKWLLNRQLALGYRLEYTGFLLYFQKQLYYSQLGLITSRAYLTTWLKPLNMEVTASYNRYVMKDSGWMLEAMRFYRETGIGAYAGVTQQDKFGGVKVRVALGRNKLPLPSVFRIVLPNYYEYAYKATTVVYTQHEPIQTGISVFSGGSLISMTGTLTPNYMENNLHLIKAAYKRIHEEKHEIKKPDNLRDKFFNK